MHLEKAKILLEKLQNQVEQVQKGADAPSSLERDLLLMYTRQLYDAFLMESPSESSSEEESPKEAPKTAQKRSSFSFKSFEAKEQAEQEETIEQAERQKAERERQQKEQEEREKVERERKEREAEEEQKRKEREKAEREREEREAEAERRRQEEEAAKKQQEEENDKEQAGGPSSDEKTNIEETKEETSSNTNEEYDELFAFEEATDLSQKLSQSPVKNLRKGLGINDKMLYGQELFGGNVGRLHDTLDALNELENMDQARAHLEKEVLSDFDWTAKDKKRYARDFLKYVRRRYL